MGRKSISLILVISILTFISESNENDTFDAVNEINSLKVQLKQLTFDVGTLQAEHKHAKQQKSDYVFSDCSEVTANFLPSGVYKIRLTTDYTRNIKAYCDTETWGGHWTRILYRSDGSVNFYRGYERFRRGFGDIDGEHFLGLESIYALTADRSRELLVLLEDADGIEAYEWYEKFAISDEFEYFALNTLGKANGTAGDSLSHHFGQKFSSFDQYYGPDSSRNCAKIFHSAWWFSDPCHQKSNLGGNYGNNTFGMGINWLTFRSHEHTLKLAAMMIRPRPGYRQ